MLFGHPFVHIALWFQFPNEMLSISLTRKNINDI